MRGILDCANNYYTMLRHSLNKILKSRTHMKVSTFFFLLNNTFIKTAAWTYNRNGKHTIQTAQNIEKRSRQITHYLLILKLRTRRLMKLRKLHIRSVKSHNTSFLNQGKGSLETLKTKDLNRQNQQKLRTWYGPQHCITRRGHNDSCGRPTTSNRSIKNKG